MPKLESFEKIVTVLEAVFTTIAPVGVGTGLIS